MIELKERSLLQLRTLVLNADGRPLSTWPLTLIPARDAVTAVWLDKANVVEEWDDAFFRSPSTRIAVPKTMMLRYYENILSEPKYCRQSVYLRDRFRCQYCGRRFQREDLNLDHVVPRSKGGRSWWDNCVACCVPCNTQKKDADARWSGRKGVPGSLRPLKAPRQPSGVELLLAGLEFIPDDVRVDWASWLYWNTELRS